jgi:replication factor A1
LLKQKPEVSFEQVRDLIDEKKRKIGAGYLTDQGALFLVAADLGVSLGTVSHADGSIKDLYVGAKDVTILGRIMNVYPSRNFIRKDTKEEVRSRTLTIYDRDSAVRVRIWDNRTNGPGDVNMAPGDLVKLSRGSVKSGLDGRPVINLSSFSQIETVKEEDSTIPNIDSITIPVEEVRETMQNVVITGNVGNPRVSQFTNSRGENTKLLQFQLSNEERTRNIRTVIWNLDETKIPKNFELDSKVRLIGVKVKQGNPQYGSGDFEIHGDEGTVLEFSGAKMDIDIKILRILSSGGETGRGSTTCLAVDNAGKFVRLAIDGALINEPLDADTMIECVPSRIFGNSMILNRDDSYVRVIENDDSVPKTSTLESKIKEIKISDAPYILEVIVLQSPNSTDVTTKSGEVVSVSDTLIGDDTGEIRLVGWRQHSEGVRNLVVGDRVKILGASATRGISGQTELTLRAESSLITIK